MNPRYLKCLDGKRKKEMKRKTSYKCTPSGPSNIARVSFVDF